MFEHSRYFKILRNDNFVTINLYNDFNLAVGQRVEDHSVCFQPTIEVLADD